MFVPFENITKITAIIDKKGKRNALVFENSENLINGWFGFSKELHFKVLSFENLYNLDEVVTLLQDLHGTKIEVIASHPQKPWTDRLPDLNFYYKFLQLLAFSFVYLSTSIAITLIGTNMLQSNYVKDQVIDQEFLTVRKDYRFNVMETASGHKMKLSGHFKYLEEEVAFYVSPIFKIVTRFESYKKEGRERLKEGYIGGLNIFFKFMALAVMLFSASYIFYKRYRIPFQDLAVFLIFPLFVLFIAFYLFH